MNTTAKTALVIAVVVVALLLLLFGGSMGSWSMMNGGMMGGGAMDGIGWMWMPALLILGLGVLIALVIFGKKK